jgi:hypothetical protein
LQPADQAFGLSLDPPQNVLAFGQSLDCELLSSFDLV